METFFVFVKTLALICGITLISWSFAYDESIELTTIGMLCVGCYIILNELSRY